MSVLLLTTNPGLEDLVEVELHEKAAAAGFELGRVEQRADGWPGRVRVHAEVEVDALRALTPTMCSIHHVMIPMWEGPLPEDGPAGLAEVARGLDWSVLAPFGTFRASCDRLGAHTFESPDVERAIGTVVDELTPLKVKLRGWDVAVRCDVRKDRATIAVQTTPRAISADRLDRPYMPRTALKPTVAWAMLRLIRPEPGSGEPEPGLILDPFCGSGTVLQEAALQLPEVRLIGGDSYARHLPGVRENLDAAGLSDRDIQLFDGDAKELSWNLEELGVPLGSVDAVVTNPPFGLRLGDRMDFERFYGLVLRELSKVVRPGGKVVMLVVKRGTFNRRLNRLGTFERKHVRVLETGRVYPGVFVLERNDRPVPQGPRPGGTLASPEPASPPGAERATGQ